VEQQDRYIRQIELPEIGTEGQSRLRNSRVLVIGAGGLGCSALQYLTTSGIGTIGIVDFDNVSLSNLHRQLLYTQEDIGAPKVTVAKIRLEQLNPDCTIHTYNALLTKKNAQGIIDNYDIIIDATDMIPARYLINDVCVAKNKPFVYGAIYKYQGQVAVFNHNGGPTYRCLFPEPGKDKIQNCDQRGVLPVLPGIIGLIQATETIKIITGLGTSLSGYLGLLDIATMQWERMRLKRKCPSNEIKEPKH
jgi:molybdopterin/thiamine biosynthesis adenylyltransferase